VVVYPGGWARDSFGNCHVLCYRLRFTCHLLLALFIEVRCGVPLHPPTLAGFVCLEFPRVLAPSLPLVESPTSQLQLQASFSKFVWGTALPQFSGAASYTPITVSAFVHLKFARGSWQTHLLQQALFV
jgi:hypothetical protein